MWIVLYPSKRGPVLNIYLCICDLLDVTGNPGCPWLEVCPQFACLFTSVCPCLQVITNSPPPPTHTHTHKPDYSLTFSV